MDDMLAFFTTEMMDMLKEKFGKYEDSWKDNSLGELRAKMDEQIKEISNIISPKIDFDRGQVKRKLIHIANYCSLLYNKLEE